MRHALVPLALASVSLFAAACGTSPTPSTSSGATTTAVTSTTQPSSTTASKPEGQLPASLVAKVCGAEDTDERSEVFVAYKNDAPHRLVVTPTRNIPDMGNIVFDMDGKRLGEDTGSEFPWENKELMEKEHARVAALMDGAVTGQKAIACR